MFVNLDVQGDYADELVEAVRFSNLSATIMEGVGLWLFLAGKETD